MTVLGTIEITESTSKTRDVAWWTTWTEVGNSAMYQTDPDAEKALCKAIDQLRRLSGAYYHIDLVFRVVGPTREKGVLIEVSA